MYSIVGLDNETSRIVSATDPSWGDLVDIQISTRFSGPPAMGHGGYISGLFAPGPGGGAMEVTLKQPTPLDTTLALTLNHDGGGELRQGNSVIAVAVPSTLHVDVPPPPSLDEAIAAQAMSPSATMNDGLGVHPVCFGCGLDRRDGDGLRIAAGPLNAHGHAQVAAPWHPGEHFADDNGMALPQFVVAALDCPGAFAFIVDQQMAGLLGRWTFEQYAPVRADETHIITGWQTGADGRKRFAGTALFTASGELAAAAHATWFVWPAS